MSSNNNIHWIAPNDDDLDIGVNQEEYRLSGKTALLVLIDSSPDMFRPWGDNSSPFKAALQSCVALWRTKVVSNPKDVVGIMLYSTEKMSNRPNYPNIYLLQNMSTVKVDMILELEKMTSTEDLDGYLKRIGSVDDYKMKDVLAYSGILFEEAKTDSFFKKIMLFTCNDNPHNGDQGEEIAAKHAFKDLECKNVEFSIVTFNEDFSRLLFFGDMLKDESSIIHPKDLEQLTQIVRIKQKLKRPLTKTTFALHPRLVMAVGIYKLVSKSLPPRAVAISLSTNEPVERIITTYRKDTAMPVFKADVHKSIEVGGQKVFLTEEEIKQIKYKHDVGIHLIGFIDEKTFDQFTWFRNNCYFIYPDDDLINGSKDLFSTLLKRCKVLGKYPLVKMIMTRGRTPKLACLIPSVNEENVPQGFHVYVVPFSDEIRSVPFENHLTSEPEMDTLMEKLVKKLTKKSFWVGDVPNPALQHKYRKLEELAFDRPIEEDNEPDFTEPDEEAIKIRLENIPAEMEEMRAADIAADGDGPPAKKRAVASAQKVNMEMEAKNERLDKLTIPILKAFTDENDIRVNGKRKKDYVDAVYEYFN